MEGPPGPCHGRVVGAETFFVRVLVSATVVIPYSHLASCFPPVTPELYVQIGSMATVAKPLHPGALDDPMASSQPAVSRQSSTSEHLAQISGAIIEAHMASDFAVPGSAAWQLIHAYLDEDFVMVNAAVHECPIPSARSLAEHTKNVKAFKRQNPHWSIQCYNPTAMIQRGSEHGAVLLTVRESGCEGKTVFSRDSVSMMHWKRNSNGAWICYRHSALRGGAYSFL